MPKVKEPTLQYSSVQHALTPEYVLKEIGELSDDAIWDVIAYIKMLREKQVAPSMNRKKLSSYAGTVSLSIDPIRYQKKIRNEWQ